MTWVSSTLEHSRKDLSFDVPSGKSLNTDWAQGIESEQCKSSSEQLPKKEKKKF